ncbi:MAG: hypothetical protein AAFW83_01785 [Pseudomonadota bacterium]
MRIKKKAAGLLSAGLIAGAVAATTAAVAPSVATTMSRLSLGEIAQSSSACVIGEAIGVEYGRDVNGVYTLTTFRVTKSAFGDAGDTIVVRSAGGRYQTGKVSLVSVTASSPSFRVGDQAMLFLTDASDGNYAVTGFSQGAFAVRERNGASIVALPTDMGGATGLTSAIDRAISARSGPAGLGSIDQ